MFFLWKHVKRKINLEHNLWLCTFFVVFLMQFFFNFVNFTWFPPSPTCELPTACAVFRASTQWDRARSQVTSIIVTVPLLLILKKCCLLFFRPGWCQVVDAHLPHLYRPFNIHSWFLTFNIFVCINHHSHNLELFIREGSPKSKYLHDAFGMEVGLYSLT